MAEEEKRVKPEETSQEGRPPAEAEEGATEVPTAEVEKKVDLTEKEWAELKKKAEERDEYLDLLLRTRADFSNYQKRVKRDLEFKERYAAQEVVKALIPAMDHLSRAIKSANESISAEMGKGSGNLKSFLEGIRLIQNEFLKALEVIGVKNIETSVGQPFDPELHEAVLEEQDPLLPDYTILEVLEPGFLLHDRVLKPAKVKVSRRPAPSPEEKSAEEVTTPSQVKAEPSDEQPKA